MNEKPKPLLFKRSTGKNAGLPCTRLCQTGHVIFVNELHNLISHVTIITLSLC